MDRVGDDEEKNKRQATGEPQQEAAPGDRGITGPDEDPQAKAIDESKKAEEQAETFEEYELELATDSPLSESDLDAIIAYAEKHNLSEVDAKALLTERESVYNRGIETIKEKAFQEFNQQKENLLNDPDFRGEKLNESLTMIDRAIDKLGGEDLREFLKGPAGNSLPLAKFLLNVGKQMQEDTFIGKSSVSDGNKPRTQNDLYKDMYPSFYDENKK